METHVSLATNEVFKIGEFAVTNSMTATALTSLLIIGFALLIRVRASIIPGRLQLCMEMLMEFFLGQLQQALGDEQKARKALPLIMTFFLFIIVGNLFGLLPLVSAFVMEGAEGSVPFFRVPTTDYSATIALALMVVLGSNILAFCIAPIRHLGTYIRLKSFTQVRKPMDLIMAFVDFALGIMDLISEFAKVISLATRLFGNIFAGEVVVAIVMSLMVWTAYLLPIPFLVLATIGGVAQAFVFCFLMIISFSSHWNHATQEAH